MSDYTSDSVPVDVRKCPVHKCWIQMNKVKDVKHRFCPVCQLKKLQEQAKVFEEAGTLPPNVRIGKI